MARMHHSTRLLIPIKPCCTMVFRTSTLPPLKREPKAFPRSSPTCAATSMPTSSHSVATPTGKPKDVVRASSFLGSTPSCGGTLTERILDVCSRHVWWLPTSLHWVQIALRAAAYLKNFHCFNQDGTKAPRRVETRSILQRNQSRSLLMN